MVGQVVRARLGLLGVRRYVRRPPSRARREFMLDGDVVVDPDRALARAARGRWPADDLRRRCCRPCGTMLALHGDQSSRRTSRRRRRRRRPSYAGAHRWRACPGRSARRGRRRTSARSVDCSAGRCDPDEQDAHRRVVEDQLLLGERALARMSASRSAVTSSKLQIQARDLVRHVDAAAARAAAEGRAVAQHLKRRLRASSLPPGRGR